MALRGRHMKVPKAHWKLGHHSWEPKALQEHHKKVLEVLQRRRKKVPMVLMRQLESHRMELRALLRVHRKLELRVGLLTQMEK